MEIGFPKKKNEEYKYTNLAEIVNKEYNFFPKREHNVSKKDLDALHIGEENFDYIVFINGELRKRIFKNFN